MSSVSDGPPISQAWVNPSSFVQLHNLLTLALASHPNSNTISPDDDKCTNAHAEFIGFTTEGGTIVRFTQPVSQFSIDQVEILGHDARRCPTVIFPKGLVRFDQAPGNERGEAS